MIKVRVSRDFIGNLSLKPVSNRVAKRVSASNAYDGGSDCYLQTDYDIEAFLQDLRPSQRREIENGWDITILMDDWTYCHMVGGQSG